MRIMPGCATRFRSSTAVGADIAKDRRSFPRFIHRHAARTSIVKFGLLPFATGDDAKSAYPGLELLATAVLLLDRTLTIAYANAAAENLFELSKRQLVGRKPKEVFADAGGLQVAVDKAVCAGASYAE